MPKSSYLNWERNSQQDADAGLRDRIRTIFEDTGRIYGFRRIIIALRAEGIVVNHKKARRLMREMDLVPRMLRREKKYSSYKGTVGKVAVLAFTYFNQNCFKIATIIRVHAANQYCFIATKKEEKPLPSFRLALRL